MAKKYETGIFLMGKFGRWEYEKRKQKAKERIKEEKEDLQDYVNLAKADLQKIKVKPANNHEKIHAVCDWLHSPFSSFERDARAIERLQKDKKAYREQFNSALLTRN